MLWIRSVWILAFTALQGVLFWFSIVSHPQRRLVQRVRAQLHSYFDPWKYALDNHLITHRDAAGYNSLDMLLEFPLVKQMTEDIGILRSAVKFSPVLVLNKDSTGIRPRWNLDEFPKERLKASMIRLKDLPSEVNEPQLIDFFASFGIVAHRVMLYRDATGAFNGSARFVAHSIEVAAEIEVRFKKEPALWPTTKKPILIERDSVHVKTHAAPSYANSDTFGSSDSDGELLLPQHHFLEEVKKNHSEFFKLVETECRSLTPQGPFQHTLRIRPCEALPQLTRLTSFSGRMLTRKKAALRTAEFKFAQWLFALLHPAKVHPFPIDANITAEQKQEEDQRALQRLVRLAEAKRLQLVYREIGPHNIHSIADAEKSIVRLIGELRTHTKPETARFMECLRSIPNILQAVTDILTARAYLLKDRGFFDFVVAKSSKKDQEMDHAPDSDSDSDTDINITEAHDEDRAEKALEQLEISVPAHAIQVGCMVSSDTFQVLWKTSTQLSVSFEELTPRLNVLWSRHTVKYEFRNVLKNVASIMWIETDIGLYPPSASRSPAPPSPASASDINSQQDLLSSPDNSASSSPKEPQEGDAAQDRPFSPQPTFLDLFVPVDSAPRLSSQEHFQKKKVGALDFTPNQCFSQMTMIRLHFDLTALSVDQIASLCVICKSLVELGLLKVRIARPAPLQEPEPASPSNPLTPLVAPVTSESKWCQKKNSASLHERTKILVNGPEEPYLAPKRLGEVDHWVKWKLACLVTQNRVRIHQIDVNVVDLILKYSRVPVFRVLERMEAMQERLFDFAKELAKALSGHPLSEHSSGAFYDLKENYSLVAHLTVSPLEIRCEGPLPEISNRLLRGYNPLQERFVRLSFRSGFNGGTTGGSMRNVGKAAVRERIGKFLLNGFKVDAISALLGFERFEFLVSSPSQLRTQKAWVYCPPPVAPEGFTLPITVQGIRNWLGSFDHIYNVAMFSARLGQGLSSTYQCFEVDPSWIQRVPEVERNGYMFSDGCASISLNIAKRAASAMNLSYIPSAFQIRLAGIKGVVSIDPRLEGDVICVRPSMEKFKAPSQLSFEVVTWTRPINAHLNKQIIQILSALGLPDQKLIDVQTAAFEKIAASSFPRTFKSPEERSNKIDQMERSWGSKIKKGSLEHRALTMLRSGFDLYQEPFLKSIITAIGLRSLQDIHSMARIPVTNGRYAIGIMDEFGLLKPGQVYFRSSVFDSDLQPGDDALLPQDPSNPRLGSNHATHLHTGLLCVSRSPCLHPGDARFVEAVNVPELSHLVDVIVFPQLGDRPLPDECSGGDLDGDQYLILWGDDFIPPKRDTPAFKHETSVQAANGGKDDNEVLPQELVSFFVNYIFDDKLSQIADAHTYWADQSDLGVFDERCLRLAEAHNVAVDAPKTGKVVPQMDELSVPSWPDFMNVNKAQVYLSKKVLGVLFRRSSEEYATLAGETGAAPPKHELDKDLIFPGHEAFIPDALLARELYQEQLSTMMKLFRLPEEASAITGEVTYNFRSERRDWENKKEGFDSYSANLRSRFRKLFLCSQSPSSLSSSHDLDVVNSKEAQKTPEVAHSSAISSATEESATSSRFFASSTASSSSDDPRPSQEQLCRASAWYVVSYDPKYRKADSLWSFPWLVEDVLCVIKADATKSRALRQENDRLQAALAADLINHEQNPSESLSALQSAPALDLTPLPLLPALDIIPTEAIVDAASQNQVELVPIPIIAVAAD